jgi:hypothetical protein
MSERITESNKALDERFNIKSNDLIEGRNSITEKVKSLVVKKFHYHVISDQQVDALLVDSVNACATEFKHALLASLVDFDSLNIKIAKKIKASFHTKPYSLS